MLCLLYCLFYIDSCFLFFTTQMQSSISNSIFIALLSLFALNCHYFLNGGVRILPFSGNTPPPCQWQLHSCHNQWHALRHYWPLHVDHEMPIKEAIFESKDERVQRVCENVKRREEERKRSCCHGQQLCCHMQQSV